LYGSDVCSVQKKAVLVAKPLMFVIIPSRNPFPEPDMTINMKIPQNTPKAVKMLRILLRVMVIQISCQRSMSNIIISFL
jgi:hypothetical protein